MKRLEQSNMKDIMNPRADWKCQLVCDVTHTLQHLIGSKETRTQFTTATNTERSSRPMQKAKPNPLAWREFHRTMTPIINGLVMLLSLLQTITNLSKEFIPIAHRLLHCRQASIAVLIGTNGWGMATIDHMEK